MKFIMIVLMTSWDPKRAFNTPGIPAHTAPLKMATAQVSGTRTHAGLFAKEIPAHAVAKAAMVSCPSAPIFSNPQRKPTATANPVKMSGVA